MRLIILSIHRGSMSAGRLRADRGLEMDGLPLTPL